MTIPSRERPGREDAERLRRLLAQFGPEPLPVELLEASPRAGAVPEDVGELLADADRRWAALERLEEAGVLTRSREGLRIRPAEPEADPELAVAAVALLEAALPRVVADPGENPGMDALASHALALADAVPETGAGADLLLRVLSGLGGALALRGRGDRALAALERAEVLAGRMETGDPFLPVVIADQRAAVLQDAGRHQEGMAAARLAAERAREVCDPGDPRLAVLWNNVGGAYKRAGDFLTAEVYFRRVLDAAGEASSGESGPGGRAGVPPGLAATACLNLSDVLRAQGRAPEARPFAVRAAEEMEALHGPLAFETADAVSNLAVLLEVLGEREEARARQRRALAMYERRLPPGHPLVVEARARLEAMEGAEAGGLEGAGGGGEGD